jgi:uncharacterized protein (TIGR02444 family)
MAADYSHIDPLLRGNLESPLTDSLWEFAFTRYEYAGVAGLCLELQDELEADINMLLAGAWLGANDCSWQASNLSGIVAACAQWRTLCLLPLRQIRRDLKSLPGAEGWYQRLKALELEAERQQLHRMEEVLQTAMPAMAADNCSQPVLIEANLFRYLEMLPAVPAARARAAAAMLAGLLTAQ